MNANEFRSRFEDFHDKHPEPADIYLLSEMSCSIARSENCSTRFLVNLKSLDTMDCQVTLDDMLLVKESLESRFGSENVYYSEGHFGYLRIYVFFDLDEIFSRAVTRA